MLAVTILAGLTMGVASAPAAETARSIDQKIKRARDATWHWQRVMQRPRTPAGSRSRSEKSIAYQRWALSVWRERATRFYRRAHHPPHGRQFRCIHRHEGSWRANTGNGYYGGLQMDRSFQRSYGRRLYRTKGTANRWTPLEQIWVAEKAYRSGRGYHPWPNTARSCGLL